jgi:hypothetical protein
VASIDYLNSPFSTWQEGLLRLVADLQDANLQKINVRRLEATAAKHGIRSRELCAMALLVQSHAHFDRQTLHKHTPDPKFTEMAAKLEDSTLTAITEQFLDAKETLDRAREEQVISAFADDDPRRLFKDTVIGFAAAELSDVSQKIGEADPFSRLARRLSLWFRLSFDYSRYGLPRSADSRVISEAVMRLAQLLEGGEAARMKQLLHIWSGDIKVKANEDAVCHIPSLLHEGYEFILGLEICGCLAMDVDSLDVDTLDALSETLGSLLGSLDDGRPATASFTNWVESWHGGRERLRLVYDSSQAFSSAAYQHNNDVLEPLLISTLEAISQGGHTVFPAGPLPLGGVFFSRDATLMETLSERAPEAADLYRLLGTEGDYEDDSFPDQNYWTGELDANAITIRDVVDRAAQRGDYALSDVLIGFWTLYCTMSRKLSLPDMSGLAKRINALPIDHRSSTYAALGMLKREAANKGRLGREVDAILSWLPVIEIGPADDLEAYMKHLFSPALWQIVQKEERRRLINAEQMFVRFRRLNQYDRDKEPFRVLIVDWSAVAERFLVRALVSHGRSSAPRQTLGFLIGEARSLAHSLPLPSKQNLLSALNFLGELDMVNKKGGKHLDEFVLDWECVVQLHAGLYRALRTALEEANKFLSN